MKTQSQFSKLSAVIVTSYKQAWEGINSMITNEIDKKWWHNAVVYQIYPRSFFDANNDGIGDIAGIISKLDYLQQLGINIIWLSPVYKSPMDDNGYDISDYQEIAAEFGTLAEMQMLINEAQKRDIRIVMDLVINHTSDEHPWFIEARKSKDSPYRDYYIWRQPQSDGSAPNDFHSYCGGSGWEFDATTGEYYFHQFSKCQPDLNWKNPKVQEEVHKMMNWWLEKGVDGFRMDVISLISKEQPELPDKEPGINGYATFNVSANGPHVHEYLQEMRQKALNNADTITVGECSGVTLEEAKKYARSDEKELNMVFQFEHMDVDSDEKAGKWTTRKMDLRNLKKILTRWQKGLQDIAWNSLYWENHDQPRSVSRFGNDSDEYREISAKMLATCIHMMQGTPYVYQGEELGMTNCPFNTLDNFRDLESINAFHELTEQGKMTEEDMMAAIGYKGRDNARTPMQWDDSAYAGFSTANPWIMVNPNYTKINAKDQINREDSVFKYYQKLIKLRHESELIVYGTYDLILDDDKDIYAYIRTLGDEKLIVYCNFSENTREVELPEEFTNGKVLISNYIDAKVNHKITLRPYEAIVIQK